VEIEWVNHAGFLLAHGTTRLLTDPWLEGRVFDDSWDLLSPTRFRSEDFGSLTHMWFSHEHPDHFHPPTLQRIDPAIRRRLTVLYQPTRDGKVATYCRGLGFPVVTLPADDWYALGEDLGLRCEPHLTSGDSWVALRGPEGTLLNVNDCVITNPDTARSIRDKVGSVDVLLTQFSYACWVGNPDDAAARRAAAREELERVRIQIEIFEPRFVIPCASFVWFCHAENDYLNDGANSIRDAYDFIRERTGATPVVLYPGDRWRLGEAWDSDAALQRYDEDLRRVDSAPRSSSPPVSLDELLRAGQVFMERLRRLNPTLFLYRVRPAHIHVCDLDRTLKLSVWGGLREARIAREACDIALSSAALLGSFRNLWGGGTLHVNARFTVPPRGDHQRFRAFAQIAIHNNHGGRYPDLPVRARRAWQWLKSSVCRRAS
jgi:UDP-MurNAc hydroxylase